MQKCECAGIGRQARLRGVCFGVRVQVPSLAPRFQQAGSDSIRWTGGWAGLRRTTGTRVYVNSVSRVRIPPCPPKWKTSREFLWKSFFYHNEEWGSYVRGTGIDSKQHPSTEACTDDFRQGASGAFGTEQCSNRWHAVFRGRSSSAGTIWHGGLSSWLDRVYKLL